MRLSPDKNPDPELDWLALRLVPGVGGVLYARLLEAFGGPSGALAASRQSLLAVRGVKAPLAEAISRHDFSTDPERELKRLHTMGGRLVHLGSEDYPDALRNVYAPPPVLYVRGSLDGLKGGGVALVGSRKATAYGLRMARELARDLALAKVAVVSGLALGVDGAAHGAALEAGGYTAGVLGCGLDVAYPARHLKLISEMGSKGAVISEFPLGTRPGRAHFPMRNRIISGLSLAVVVVEAGERSGALITARHALDQGREVFAVPGPVGSASQGCHNLIKQGAGLLTSSAELLAPDLFTPRPLGVVRAPEEPAELPPEAAGLMKLLSADPVHVDTLVRQSGLAPQEVTALLVNLELSGLVASQPGKHYVLG